MIRPNYYHNPWKMGLMSGAADLFGGLAKGFQMQAVLNNRLDAYNARYDRMADVQRERMRFQAMNAAQARELNMMKQKLAPSQFTGPDGQLMQQDRAMRPDDKGNYVPTNIGTPYPVQAKAGGMTFEQHKALADAHFQNALKLKNIPPPENPGAARREAAKSVDNKMAEFGKLDEEQRKQRLLESGIDPEAPNARAQYEKLMKQQAYQSYGVTDDAKASKPKGATKAAPDVRYGPDGKAYVKGPDGKPVPYNPQASADEQTQDGEVADNGDGTSEDGDQQQVASNDPLPMDQEHLQHMAEDADEFGEDQPQQETAGLMDESQPQQEPYSQDEQSGGLMA